MRKSKTERKLLAQIGPVFEVYQHYWQELGRTNSREELVKHIPSREHNLNVAIEMGRAVERAGLAITMKTLVCAVFIALQLEPFWRVASTMPIKKRQSVHPVNADVTPTGHKQITSQLEV